MTSYEKRKFAEQMTKVKITLDGHIDKAIKQHLPVHYDISTTILKKRAALDAYFVMLHILGYHAFWDEQMQSYIINPI